MNEFGPLLVVGIAPLQRYAAKLTHDRAKADDLVQSCLLRALVKRNLSQPGTSLRKWLFTMLYHQWINELRRNGRERNSLSDAGRALAPAPLRSGSGSPLSHVHMPAHARNPGRDEPLSRGAKRGVCAHPAGLLGRRRRGSECTRPAGRDHGSG